MCAAARAQDCGYAHMDGGGRFWYYNLTALRGDAYTTTSADASIVASVCTPLASRCAPLGAPGTPSMGAAIRYMGTDPPQAARCALPAGGPAIPCTRPCEVLGSGELGARGADWRVIDPARPTYGAAATHRIITSGMPNESDAPFAVHNASDARCVDPASGRPMRELDVQYVCDVAQAQPTFETVSLVGAPPCRTTLRFRASALCFTFGWRVGEWGACTATLATNGAPAAPAARSREVECLGNGTSARDEGYCPQPRPIAVQPCDATAPAGPAAGDGVGGGGDAVGDGIGDGIGGVGDGVGIGANSTAAGASGAPAWPALVLLITLSLLLLAAYSLLKHGPSFRRARHNPLLGRGVAYGRPPQSEFAAADGLDGYSPPRPL